METSLYKGRTRGVLIALLSALTLAGCAVNVPVEAPAERWRLVFAHEAGGTPTQGSKAKLIDAIRQGKPIRLYWRGRTVEHSTDAVFTTILGGEVFAQTASIQGQKPVIDPPSIELRETRWQGLFSTNGKRPLRWFVQD